MDDEIVASAKRVEAIFPRIARRLFALAVNHPAAELPVAQLRMCSHLLSAGTSSVTDVAEEIGVSLSAATQIADRLEKLGFVQRNCDLRDRRVKLLTLTQEGHSMMVERCKQRVHRVAQILATLEPSDRSKIIDSLNILLEASMTMNNSTSVDELTPQSRG